MNRSGGAGWLVVVLALMGVAVGPLRGGSAPASAREGAPARADEAGAETQTSAKAEDIATALDQADLPRAPKLTQALRESVEERLGYELEDGTTLTRIVDVVADQALLSTVLVSLPDPRHGNQARYFDQGIDALRRGAQEHGFAQLKFVLPVPKEAEESADKQKEAACPGCPCFACKPAKPTPEPEPYFLVFGRGSELLVCLLVMESPVQGPKAGDVPRALALARRLEREGADQRFLGPFFSGSAASLGVQLEKFQRTRGEWLHFDVISGTATGRNLGSWFEWNPTASFRRTTPNDIQVLAFLFRELARRHQGWMSPALGAPKIAVLGEFDTAFGQDLDPDQKRKEKAPNQASEPLTLPFDFFRYPSSVSKVRQVRQQQKKKTAEGDNGDPLSLRRTLQLDVAPDQKPDEDLPPLLSPITAFERELEIGEQLTRICRERYDYLILTATDPLDLIFLAEEARKYCPGLSLIALGAEKMFKHPDVQGALEGLLIVGSYPLLFEVPPWGAKADRPFSSHAMQGFYNAWLTFLNEARPNAPVRLLGYRGMASDPRCADPKAQPVWLTGLSAGTFWPLRAGCVASEDAVVELLPTSAVLAPPPSARVTGVVRAAGLFLLAAALAQAFWMRRPAMRSLREDVLGARYRLGANLTLFVLLGLVLPALLHAHGDPGAAPWLGFAYQAASAVVGGFLFVFAAYGGKDAYHLIIEQKKVVTRYGWRETWASSLSVATLFGFGVSFLLLAAAWIGQHFSLPPIERQFVLTRMYNPIGMSPLAPVAYLAMAYYLWSFVGLCRVRALVRFSGLAPLPLRGESLTIDGDKRNSGSTLTPALDDVVSNMRGAWSGNLWRYEVFAAGLAAVPGVYFCLRVRPTWEGPAYDWLLKLGLIVLYGLVVVASVHFLTLVSLFRRFLRQLAALPMVDSYDRVAIKMKSSFGIQFGVRVPTFEELQLSGYTSTLLDRLMATDVYEPARGPAPKAGPIIGEPATATVSTQLDAQARALRRTGGSDHPEPELELALDGKTLSRAYQDIFAQTRGAFEVPSAKVQQALGAFRRAEGNAAEVERDGHQALHESSKVLFAILKKLWALRAGAPKVDMLDGIDPKEFLRGGDLAGIPTVALYGAAAPPRALLWMRVAEDFVTLRIATFVSHVMTHLRYLLTFSLAAALLLILAVSAYPLEPTRFVTVFSWTLMLAVIVLAFSVIVRMERNEVLSRLSGSTPGRIDFNFALAGQLVVYVGLPLLAVLANIFPELRDQLFAWAGPLRRLLP